MKNQEQIDTLIRKYSKNWDFSRISVVNKAILRLSVYALLYTWEVPKNVTIDEAVELTKEFESEESARFVNGILDAILKNEIKSDG